MRMEGQADGGTDGRTKLIVAFRNFANAPSKVKGTTAIIVLTEYRLCYYTF